MKHRKNAQTLHLLASRQLSSFWHTPANLRAKINRRNTIKTLLSSASRQIETGGCYRQAYPCTYEADQAANLIVVGYLQGVLENALLSQQARTSFHTSQHNSRSYLSHPASFNSSRMSVAWCWENCKHIEKICVYVTTGRPLLKLSFFPTLVVIVVAITKWWPLARSLSRGLAACAERLNKL